ncbi:MAG: hypothetical protein ACU0DK_10775 [Pseudooceanicola sp.]
MGGYGMAYGGTGFLWWLVMAALLVIPFWRLLPKFGLNQYIALVAIIPLGALILLWILAFRDKIDGGSQ